METAILALSTALAVSTALNGILLLINKYERDRIFNVLTTEKAPTYTRIEARKRELEAFASIEDDDEGDMPDGLL